MNECTYLVLFATFRSGSRHQKQDLLLLLVRRVLGELLQNVGSRQRHDVDVVQQSSAVSRGTRERGLLGRIFVQVLHGEDGVQVQVKELTDALDQVNVVGRVDSHVVAGIVADPGDQEMYCILNRPYMQSQELYELTF